MTNHTTRTMVQAIEAWLSKAVETRDVKRARHLLEQARSGLEALASLEPKPVQQMAYLSQRVAVARKSAREMGLL